MHIAIITERLETLPEEISASSAAVAGALAGRGHRIDVICDTVESRTLLAGTARITARRGVKGRMNRQPIAFASWARRYAPTLGVQATISFTPVAPADLWFVGTPLGREALRQEIARLGRFGGLLHYRVWHLARAIAARRARTPGDSAILAAQDRRAAARAATHLRVDPGRITLIPRASGLIPPPADERDRIRREVRAVLDIPDDAVALLFSATRSNGPAAREIIDGFALALERTGRPCVLVILGSRQVHATVRSTRLGCCDAIIPIGWTGRLDALLAACDVGLAPRIERGVLDVCFIADCIRFGLPVIADAGAPGAELIESIDGLVVPSPDPGTWADALVTLIEPQALARAQRAIDPEAAHIDRLTDTIESLLVARVASDPPSRDTAA